jgi:hypothetical protein
MKQELYKIVRCWHEQLGNYRFMRNGEETIRWGLSREKAKSGVRRLNRKFGGEKEITESPKPGLLFRNMHGTSENYYYARRYHPKLNIGGENE